MFPFNVIAELASYTNFLLMAASRPGIKNIEQVGLETIVFAVHDVSYSFASLVHVFRNV